MSTTQTAEDHIGYDYSHGRHNRDPIKPHLHFGAIPMHAIQAAWCELALPNYGLPEDDDCACPNCEHDCSNKEGPTLEWGDPIICEECGESFELTIPDMREPNGHDYTGRGYVARQAGDDRDVVFTKSPYYTTCQYCSPCMPGGGYILNTRTNPLAPRTYCPGHEWFDNERAPYPVYRVSDIGTEFEGTQVYPKPEQPTTP